MSIKLYCNKCGVRLWILSHLPDTTTIKELEELCLCENCKVLQRVEDILKPFKRIPSDPNWTIKDW
jgi:hypothetical protein